LPTKKEHEVAVHDVCVSKHSSLHADTAKIIYAELHYSDTMSKELKDCLKKKC